MDIDKPQASACEPVGLDKMQELILCDDRGNGEGLQQGQDLPSILDDPADQLADNKRVADDFGFFKQGRQP